MKINYTLTGGILILSPEGELDHHCAMTDLSRMRELIEVMLPPNVLLDLAGMPFTDSSGIAVLMNLYRAARRLDSGFAIVNTQPQQMKVFRAAGLDRILSFRTEEVHI